MNRSEIYDTTRAMAVRPNLSDDQLFMALQITEGELNTFLREHPRMRTLGLYTIPTEDGQGTPYTTDTPYIPMPVDVNSLVSIVDEDGKQYMLWPASSPGNIPNSVFAYIERGMMLELFPTPPRGKTFTMDYYSLLAPLADDPDSNWVSIYFPNAYIYGMLYNITIMTKDIRRAPDIRNQFNIIIDQIMAQGWNQNIATGFGVKNVG